MKKIYITLVSVLATINAVAQFQGFENWSSQSTSILDLYQNGNSATISNDAQLGSKSIKLETTFSNNDTLFAFIMSGDIDNGIPTQSVSLTNVDSIVGYYKSDILPNDSALMVVQTKYLGALTSFKTNYFKGTHSTWTRFSFSINALTVDSILMGCASADPINNSKGKPGSWIMLDNIQLKAANGSMSPVDNHSFENWTTHTVEKPIGWSTTSDLAVGSPTLPVVKSTDAFAGNYAIELSAVNTMGGPLKGIATNGTFGTGAAVGGQSVTIAPTQISFQYKYAPVGLDTAVVIFDFYNNGVLVERKGGQLHTASNYSLVAQSLTTTTVDTVLITLFAGNNIGSKLKVDEINLLFPVGITEMVKVEKIVAYPNPATDQLNLKFSIKQANEVTILVKDINGKIIDSRQLGNINEGEHYQTLQTNNYSSGLYFIDFVIGQNKVSNQFIIE